MANFHTDSFGASQNALGAAFHKLLELGAVTGQAAVAVHQLSNLTGIINEVLSPAQIAALAGSHRRVTLNGVTVFLVTERQEPEGFTRGPLLAVHVDSAFLAKLQVKPRYTDLVYVPWTEQERAVYLQTSGENSTEVPFVKEEYLTNP
jgi:hypothetical protein